MGWGIRFGTYASVFDVLINPGAQGVAVYVTDPATGVRARAQENDYLATATSGNGQTAYWKFDFGARGYRIVEIYPGDGGHLFGVDVPMTDTIWAVADTAPRAGIILDSWGQHAVSDTGTVNNIKLGMPDYLFAGLGIANYFNLSTGGTGVVATNADAAGGPVSASFAQRVAAGDLAASRIGDLDLLFAPASLNDSVTTKGGTADDGLFAAAYAAYLRAVMAAQPNAIIIGYGPEFTTAAQIPQSRFDAANVAFAAGGVGESRAIWLDNSPAGENWLFGDASNGANQVMIGPDGYHPTRVGAAYFGRRVAGSALAAIREAFAI